MPGFSEDLGDFFTTAGFGTSVTWSGGEVLVGIFDNDYVEEFGMEGRRPVLHCKTSEAGNVALNETATISGASYKLIRKEPDGTGVTLMILEKQ